MRYLKAKIRLKNGFKIIVLLDIGAKINIIIKEVIKDIRLIMRQRLKLELILYTGYSQLFLGLYKDVKVIIEGLKIRHPIFVIEAKNHYLVLG